MKVVAQRLFDELGPSGTTGYEVIGTPTSEEEIRALARNNPLQFERWVIGRLGARPRGYSRADRGADADLELPGRLGGGGRARAVVEVKAREFRAVDLENLRLVARLDRADAGVLVVLTMTGDATQSYGRGEPPLTPEEGSPPPILLVIPAAELLDEDGAQRFAAILADAVAHG